MTWLKTAEEFPLECAAADLSDAAYRTHHEGLSYALERENDGVFHARDVRRFAESPKASEAVEELISKGFWERLDDGLLMIKHHMEHQPSAANIKDKRQNNAMRQRRHRELEALTALGLSQEEAEAELVMRGIPLPKTPAKSRTRGASRRDGKRDELRDKTRDPERSGTERNGAERQPLQSRGAMKSSSLTRATDLGWLNGDPAPIGGGLAGLQHSYVPDHCATPSCNGRLTEFAIAHGKSMCLECERKMTSSGTYG